jgi:hypothetical protein
MPRFAVLVCLLLGCTAVSSAAAQRRELTVLFGGTLTGASGGNLDQMRARGGFAAGLSLRLPRSSQFSLETQALFVQRRLFGQRPATTQPPLAAGPLADAADLRYLQVPILLRFQRGYSSTRPIRPYLTLGPYLGVRLGCKREITESNGNRLHADCTVAAGTFSPGSETFLPAVYQEVDVGIQGGIGVELRALTFGVSFGRSIRDMVESAGGVHTSPFDSSRMWIGMFSIEYLIRVI